MIAFLIISGSGVDSISGPFYVFFTLSGKGWAGSGVGVMSDIKNKNFSFRAVAFSGKLFSVIAATMSLLLVDGAIHDAPAPTDKYFTNLNNISKWKPPGINPPPKIKVPDQAPFSPQENPFPGYNYQPAPTQTETFYPMAICNAFMFNGQKCTEGWVTAVVAGLTLGAIAGFVTLAQNELNHEWNSAKQKENTRNLLILLSQQKSGGSGSGSTCTASQHAQGFC